MVHRHVIARYRTEEIMNTLFSFGFEFDKTYNMGGLGLPANIEWAYGATRLVVWDWDYPDFVVKIPLYTDCFKYCEKEAEIYRTAVADGVDRYFAWCDFIDYYNDWPVYAMEFVNCDSDTIEDESYSSAYKSWCEENGYDSEDEKVSDEFNDLYYSDEMCYDSILDWFYDQVSDVIEIALRKFIGRNKVNDIHAQNVGYLNGHVCLCDYAGFGW